MIDSEWRFYSPEGYLTPGGPHTWIVIDWDSRRWFQITGSAKALPDDEDAIKILTRYIDQLGPDVHSLKVSDEGELLSASSDNDPTWEIRYPQYPGSLEGNNEVLNRSELTELDRLGVCTDLVSYKRAEDNKDNKKEQLAAFKYTIIQQRVKNIWDELHILKGLKGHKSFVDFHHVIIDDVNHNVLGFTSEFISGGTLQHYDQIFYFDWLKQITSGVDDLNLRFGIMHQDVAPRNVLVDPTTNSLKIFDFDRSALIGSKEQKPGRDDVDGVVFTIYETLTKDEHYRDMPFDEQEVKKVEDLENWDMKISLEDGKGGIAAYRKSLSEWATERRCQRIQHYSEATNPISWPDYIKPELFWLTVEDEPPIQVLRRYRADAVKDGDYVVSWERPPQKSLYKLAIMGLVWSKVNSFRLVEYH